MTRPQALRPWMAWALAAVLGAGTTQSVGAQAGLDQRIQAIRNGTLRFTLPAARYVCGNGSSWYRSRDGRSTSYNGMWNGSTNSKDVETICDRGPVRIVVVREDGDTRSLRHYVGGRWVPQDTVTDLGAVSSELDRLGTQLAAAVVDLTAARDEQQELTSAQESAMNTALGAYEDLSEKCKEMQSRYEAEQARIRAAEKARREAAARAASSPSSGGSSTYSGSRVVGGIICPFNPGRTHFSDSWGAGRSGGRSHKGVDMMAPYGEPIYAVVSGSVSIRNGGLGGKTIWLSGGGNSYYYAHLSDWAVSGGSVSQGQLIAYNGATGNAAGGSPHLHFEIHPGGWGAINPYPSVAAVCF